MAWTAPATQTTGTHMTVAIWNEQITNNLAFLGTNHDHSGDAGDGATITDLLRLGMIGIFDAACPSGWTRVSVWDGKFLRGSATYNAAAGGAANHTHTTAAHVHTNAGHTHDWNHTHTGPSHTHDQRDAGVITNRAATNRVLVYTSGTPLAGNQMYAGSSSGGPVKLPATGFQAAGTGNTGIGTGTTTTGGTADTGSAAGAATGNANNLPVYIEVVFCKKD